jgi:hypothetical protein
MELIGHEGRIGTTAPPAGPRPHGLATRIRARLRQRSLDARLAAGADPAGDPVLSWRAAQLANGTQRARLAESLEELVAVAEIPRPAMSAAVPIRREAIRAARPELLGLAGELAAGAPVHPRGVAMVRCMLMDGASTLYSGSGSVERAAADAHRALIESWT